MSERVNHLVFRAFGVENGQEELTVPILTFRELESGKDLSERWRCCLWWVTKVSTQNDAEREGEREREGQTCSRTDQEESIRCWGWTVEFMGGEGRRGGMDVRDCEDPSISTPSEEEWIGWWAGNPSHRRCS